MSRICTACAVWLLMTACTARSGFGVPSSRFANADTAPPADDAHGDTHRSDGNTSDGNTSDGNTSDGNTSDGNTSDGNAGDGNAGDGNTSDGNAGDGNAGDVEPADHDLLSDVVTGLVGSWSFDEASGNNAVDDSGHGHDGVITGATRVVGRRGNALSFDGSSYVTVPYHVELELSAGFTLAAWFQATAPSTAWWRLIDRNYVTSYFLGTGGGTNDLSVWLDDVEVADTADQLFVPGSWHHAAATYDGSAVVVYLDGQRVAQGSHPGGMIGGTDSLYFGGRADHHTSFAWRGLIDEVRIYSRVLTPGDIGALRDLAY